MKRLLLLAFAALVFTTGSIPLLSAQETAAPTTVVGKINEKVEDVVSPILNKFTGLIFTSVKITEGKDPATGEIKPVMAPIVVGWLILAASIFTFYFGFIQFRGFKHSINLVRGRYTDPKAPGDVSHFQALATALSGTVGLGNIAGVAVAISVGGPGATFWMILAGLFGMASKFTECTLGLKYRKFGADGTVSGGPMYYLQYGFAERGAVMGIIGRGLAILFAIFVILGALGGGNMFQSNQAASQITTGIFGATGAKADLINLIVGLTFAIIVGFVIIGGIKSIARVTEKVVPFMAILYVGSAVLVLILNFSQIPAAFGAIFEGAFTGSGILGGFIGVLFQGVKRATFSNEAGVGSAVIAHSAARTERPVAEGMVALLEPLVDTVVICTMTALVLVITGFWNNPDYTGAVLTSKAFSSELGSIGSIVMTLAIVLFAFSTMLSWSYYGLKGWNYLLGTGKEKIFQVFFCIFIVIGAVLKLGPVIDFSDAAIFAMAFVNIIGLYVLLPVVKRELKDYLSKLKSGEIKRIR